LRRWQISPLQYNVISLLYIGFKLIVFICGGFAPAGAAVRLQSLLSAADALLKSLGANRLSKTTHNVKIRSQIENISLKYLDSTHIDGNSSRSDL
jgi:hypothetical protein